VDYKETLEYLYNQLPAYHRIGKAAYKDNLHNSTGLDNYFGNPHNKFLTIHVAGTNGKGSVSHMIASVLQESGYKTGLYTSPHLVDFRERIKVNGEMIPENEIVTFAAKHIAVLEAMQPSFFEMTVAMAFNYFADCQVDIAVIEVGLGGRLDSTNIITPVLSVITNIGHDHMDLLGDTLEKVAAEKAGIIKKSVPVVISETHSETRKVFVNKAKEKGSRIDFADDNFSCTLEKEFNTVNGFRRYVIKDINENVSFEGSLELGGDYQSNNIKAVFQVFKSLNKVLRITDENILQGIRKVVANTGLNGRWQIISTEPLIVCDTGHNKEGLEYVMNQISRIPRTKLHMVIGFVSDKDLASVLPLFPGDAIYYFTKASVPRALNENILMQNGADFGLFGNSFPDVASALENAKMMASGEDVIFIGGSTFIVADALKETFN
jgi:dihydrofolate synthase/folylpolyglutamate synthase